MAKELIRSANLSFNDDDSVTIRIEPAPSPKKKDNDDGCHIWSGELTATASSFDNAIEKLKSMYNLEMKKGEKPKNILEDYLSK